jgi:hypothetical protein
MTIMVLDAIEEKRDYVRLWVGQMHPDDIAQVTESRISLIQKPEFENADRVHDWRNHVGEATKSLWSTFTDEQKAAIALDSEYRANLEEWE